MALFNLVAPFDGGWILEHLAAAIEAESPVALHRIRHVKGGTDAAVAEVLARAGEAVGTIYAHHVPLHAARLADRAAAGRDVLFFGHYFEHPEHNDWPPVADLAPSLASTARIWTNAACWDRWLIERGVRPGQISRIVRAVDSELFAPRPPEAVQDRFTVGMVSQYHYRKNERFMLDAVRRWPDVDWLLLGRNWETTPLGLLSKLAGADNFTFIDTRSISYESWPSVFHRCDAFLSPSFCEGGPFPLLEAMACGVWPIASRTGFAEDIITQGRTGHVFDIDDDDGFDACLSAAFDLARGEGAAERVRAQVTPFTWKRYAAAAVADLQALAAGRD